jgi:hypothetical protein
MWRRAAGIDRHRAFVADAAFRLTGKTVADRKFRVGAVQQPDRGNLVVTTQASQVPPAGEEREKRAEHTT